MSRLLTEFEKLMSFCGDQKHLFHGDFGFDNVLSDGSRVTGVLDWAECGYGEAEIAKLREVGAVK